MVYFGRNNIHIGTDTNLSQDINMKNSTVLLLLVFLAGCTGPTPEVVRTLDGTHRMPINKQPSTGGNSTVTINPV